MTDPVPLDTLSQAQWEPFAKSRGESTGLAPRVLLRHTHIFMDLGSQVGNFKEICPNFLILIFSILDISKGHEENLRKKEQ